MYASSSLPLDSRISNTLTCVNFPEKFASEHIIIFPTVGVDLLFLFAVVDDDELLLIIVVEFWGEGRGDPPERGEPGVALRFPEFPPIEEEERDGGGEGVMTMGGGSILIELERRAAWLVVHIACERWIDEAQLGYITHIYIHTLKVRLLLLLGR